MAPGPAQPSPYRRPLAPGPWALGLAVVLAIAACRPASPPVAEPPPPPVEPAPTATSQPPSPTPAVPEPATPELAGALPDTLVQQWEPQSNVLLAFGAMTITPTEVQWASGQTSPYTLISTEDGYLLKLETSPAFYDTQNQYIKLLPKAPAGGSSDSLEVAFYPGESQLQSDEYVMYGSYFSND